MKLNYKICFVFIFATFLFLLVPGDGFTQCPMCRMAAESNLENGGSEGAGLNTGILYMLAMPYLLVLTIGFIWYRNRRIDLKNGQSTEI